MVLAIPRSERRVPQRAQPGGRRIVPEPPGVTSAQWMSGVSSATGVPVASTPVLCRVDIVAADNDEPILAAATTLSKRVLLRL